MKISSVDFSRFHSLMLILISNGNKPALNQGLKRGD
jgi:hypothetical protein